MLRTAARILPGLLLPGLLSMAPTGATLAQDLPQPATPPETPTPVQPAEQPLEVPPQTTPTPGAPPQETPPVPAPPAETPPVAAPPVVVTHVSNVLPPPPPPQAVYPPCSATLRDQCTQREGSARPARHRKRH